VRYDAFFKLLGFKGLYILLMTVNILRVVGISYYLGPKTFMKTICA